MSTKGGLQYRVVLTAKGAVVGEIIPLYGMRGPILPVDGTRVKYKYVTDLPEWMQKKIAALMITDPTPPTREIPGVGRRMRRNIYWITADTGNGETL
mgnify:CR=1 FL=1